MGRIPFTLDEILAVGRRTEDGCLLWPFSTNVGGYGNVMVDGQRWKVHRFVWTQLRGEIPDDMTIDHVCHNEAARTRLCNGGDSCLHRRCFEVSHLDLKTQLDNWRAGLRGGRPSEPLRDICRKGHPLTGDNLLIEKDGKPRCRTCRNATAQASRDRRRPPPKPPRTHCFNGHPWIEENLLTAYGRTQCRVCRRASVLRSIKKRRDARG